MLLKYPVNSHKVYFASLCIQENKKEGEPTTVTFLGLSLCVVHVLMIFIAFGVAQLILFVKRIVVKMWEIISTGSQAL